MHGGTGSRWLWLALVVASIAGAPAQAGDDFDAAACLEQAATGEGMDCTPWYQDERWVFTLEWSLGPDAQQAARELASEYYDGLGLQVGPDSAVVIAARDRRNMRFGANGWLLGKADSGPFLGVYYADPASPSCHVLADFPIDEDGDFEVTGTLEEEQEADEGTRVRFTRVSRPDIGTISIEAVWTQAEAGVTPPPADGAHTLVLTRDLPGDPEVFYRYNGETGPIRLVSWRGIEWPLLDHGLPTANLASGGVTVEYGADPTPAARHPELFARLLGDPANELIRATVKESMEVIPTVHNAPACPAGP